MTTRVAHGAASSASRGPGEALVLAILSDLEGLDGEAEEVALNPEMQQRIAQSFQEVAHLRGATAGIEPPNLAVTYGAMLMDILESFLGPEVDTAVAAKIQAVESALGDVAKWYADLDPKKSEAVRVSRQDDYSCAISQKTFDEIERPVAVRTGKVVHVFEAEDLLRWMQTSMQTKDHLGEATNPVDRSPLHLEAVTRATNVLYGPVGPTRG